jgi:hypothetical protein
MRSLAREKFLLAEGTDPIWWRPRGEPAYRRLTPGDVAALRERFVRAGNQARLDG